MIDPLDRVLEVLEIGANIKPQAFMVFPGAKISYVEADETIQKAAEIEDAEWFYGDARSLSEILGDRTFDVIFASHVLEHFPWWDTERILKNWVSCLREGGSLHIVVPSLEWAAKQILSENPSLATIPHLYSDFTTPWNIHGTGFTMRLLRSQMERAGLSVASARSGTYAIHVAGQILEAEQHYVAGYKLEGLALRKE